MQNCIVKYLSIIDGEKSHFKASGVLNRSDGKIKLLFSLEDGQNYSFYILNDGSIRLKSDGQTRYSILFKNNLNYPFFIFVGAFKIDASATTILVKTKANNDKVEIDIQYVFSCGKVMDNRTIKICAESI